MWWKMVRDIVIMSEDITKVTEFKILFKFDGKIIMKSDREIDGRSYPICFFVTYS